MGDIKNIKQEEGQKTEISFDDTEGNSDWLKTNRLKEKGTKKALEEVAEKESTGIYTDDE